MCEQELEHLTFKGVPIDGTIDEFVEKLKAFGFEYLETTSAISFLKGVFAGFADCIVGVGVVKGTNTVYLVGVQFPVCADWSTLEKDYVYLKNLLIKKYGEPSKIIEEFTGCSQPKDNVEKLHELYMDRCVWGTLFRVKNGEILLILRRTLDGRGCYVMLKYFDKINTALINSEAMEDL